MKKLLALSVLVVIFAGCAPVTETSTQEPLVDLSETDKKLTQEEQIELHAASRDYDCPAIDAVPKCQDPATVKEGELRRGPKAYCVWIDDNCKNVKYIEESN